MLVLFNFQGAGSKHNYYFITRLFLEKLKEEIIWIAFNFCRHVVKAVLATRLEHQFRLEPLYWLLCICSVFLCSSGCLGNIKGVLCFSIGFFFPVIFLFHSITSQFEFFVAFKAGVCRIESVWVSHVITSSKWLTGASCSYVAPTQSTNGELLRLSITWGL